MACRDSTRSDSFAGGNRSLTRAADDPRPNQVSLVGHQDDGLEGRKGKNTRSQVFQSPHTKNLLFYFTCDARTPAPLRYPRMDSAASRLSSSSTAKTIMKPSGLYVDIRFSTFEGHI